MDSKMISSQIIIKPQQNLTAKILVGSGQNFKRSPDVYERPLMVNAWCQTTNDDFKFLHEFEHKQEQTKRENELLEKIRILEENLKAHTELLSQIHATSARTSALLGQSSTTVTEQISVKPIQIQTIESQSSSVNTYKITEPRLSRSSHNSPTSSVINPQQMPTNHMESVKYTIIAEGAGDAHGEPIEIQLAEDDGALNLNTSADSDRLEICLASDDMEIKTETLNTLSTASSTITPLSRSNASSEQNFLKRRRLPADENEEPADNSYSYEQTKRRLSNNNNNIKTENQYQSTPKQQPSPSSSGNDTDIEYKLNMDNVMVSIGPNNTRIPAKIYESMNWSSASIATRKLLMAIFDRKTLATHSMTGKPSPAFKDHGKPLKQMLDPLAIQDIIFAVTRKCNVSEKEVRNAITTKCADENKMMKLQLNKRTPMREIKKENSLGVKTNMMM